MNNIVSKILSPRELEVLQLVSHEYTINEIANKLFISHHTVISHRKNILTKMDAKNTAGMIRRAFELNFLTLQNQSV